MKFRLNGTGVLLFVMESESKIFSDGGKDLHYYVRGNGKFSIVVLHGLGSSGKSFYRGIVFDNPNVTTYYVDLPGHGDSYDLVLNEPNEWIDLISNFCKNLNSKNIMIIGFSLGGKVGISAAEKLAIEGYNCSLYMWSTPLMLNSRKSISLVALMGMSFLSRVRAVLKNSAFRKVLGSLGFELSGQDWNDILETNPYVFGFAKKIFRENINSFFPICSCTYFFCRF